MRWKSTFAFNNGVATLGPPPEGYVWTITLSVPNAQSDQTFALTMQESLQSYQLTSLAGTAGFGPYQIFPQEQMLVTAQQGTTPNQLVVVFGRQDLVKDAPTGIYPSVWGGTVTTTGFNAMQWQGDWISTASYLIGAIVVGPDGRTYVATASNANTPPPNVSYWAQLEPLAGQNVAIYNVPGSYTWQKPNYGNTVHFLIVGSGGGGGGGASVTSSGTPAGGGGGGSGAGYVDFTCLFTDVPSSLNVVVGAGGSGGAGGPSAGGSGSAGSNGNDTTVSGTGLFLQAGPGAGGGGGSSAGGGSGPGGWTSSDFPAGGGGTGGYNSPGSFGNYGYPRTQGGGGGGGAGGATAYDGALSHPGQDSPGLGNASGGVAPSGAGGAGLTSGTLGPSTGGGGGAGGDGTSGGGGAGGVGGLGSGGGGGGACYVNSSGTPGGGAGGDGGPGIAVIIVT